MAKSKLEQEGIEKVDKRSGQLMDEAKGHLRQCRERHPDCDARLVFEGWAIQKIAGLQVIVEQQAEALEKLRTYVRSRR